MAKNFYWSGKKQSSEHRKKISEGLNRFYSENPVWNKGKKMGKILKLQGRIPWNKGKSGVQEPIEWTFELRQKARQRQLGKNNSNWRGGTSSEKKKIQGSAEWKNWRIRVFQRDDFTCRECDSKKCIEPHHIKQFSIYIELRFDVGNGLTLCKECHRKTDNYGSKALLRKRGEFGGTPERTIPSRAKDKDSLEGVTVRGEIIPISAPHSIE